MLKTALSPAMALLLVRLAGPLEAQITPDTLVAKISPNPEGIWFKHADNMGKRFLYSQAIEWPSSVGAHIVLWIRQGPEEISLKTYRRTFTLPPVWDNDHWSWNYEVHPIMGSFSYLAYRNRQAHWAEAIAGTAINSVIYEYLIAGGTQQPSWYDMMSTPILGSLLGEGIYQIKKLMLKDKYLSIWEKIFITVTDPFEAFYYGFNYKKIASVSYR
ncbi:MAG: DUF3943 domain-containing protein [Bacteroidota bacterium]